MWSFLSNLHDILVSEHNSGCEVQIAFGSEPKRKTTHLSTTDSIIAKGLIIAVLLQDNDILWMLILDGIIVCHHWILSAFCILFLLLLQLMACSSQIVSDCHLCCNNIRVIGIFTTFTPEVDTSACRKPDIYLITLNTDDSYYLLLLIGSTNAKSNLEAQLLRSNEVVTVSTTFLHALTEGCNTITMLVGHHGKEVIIILF